MVAPVRLFTPLLSIRGLDHRSYFFKTKSSPQVFRQSVDVVVHVFVRELTTLFYVPSRPESVGGEVIHSVTANHLLKWIL